MPQAFSMLKIIPYNIVIAFLLLFLKEVFAFENTPFFLFSNLSLAGLFTCFILGNTNPIPLSLNQKDKKFLSYIYLQFFLQWILGPLLVWWMFQSNDLLMLTLPASFAGGHGSVIYISNIVNNPYRDLMLMSATVGVMLSISGGVLISKKRIRNELSNCINIKAILIVTLILLVSYFLNILLSLPIFIYAIILSLLIKPIIKTTFNSTSNLFVDLLVIFSVASINFYNVYNYLNLLFILWGLGLFIAIISYKLIAPKFFKESLFETNLFTWGWTLGGIGIGLGLIKNCDKDLSEKIFNQYARVYFYIAIVEISLISVVPFFFKYLT